MHPRKTWGMTIRAAVGPDAKPHDLVRPGHVFPLRAVRGDVGVHAEGSVNVAQMAGYAI
jgi:3,4-dihydroxy 2-butanone 4-phosphate synthase